MKAFVPFIGFLFICCAPSMTISGNLTKAERIRHQLNGGYFYWEYEMISSYLQLKSDSTFIFHEGPFTGDGKWRVSPDGKYLQLRSNSKIFSNDFGHKKIYYDFKIKNACTLILEEKSWIYRCFPDMATSGSLSEKAEILRQQLDGACFEWGVDGSSMGKSILKFSGNKFQFHGTTPGFTEGTWTISDNGTYIILEADIYAMCEFRVENANILIFERNNWTYKRKEESFE